MVLETKVGGSGGGRDSGAGYDFQDVCVAWELAKLLIESEHDPAVEVFWEKKVIDFGDSVPRPVFVDDLVVRYASGKWRFTQVKKAGTWTIGALISQGVALQLWQQWKQAVMGGISPVRLQLKTAGTIRSELNQIVNAAATSKNLAELTGSLSRKAQQDVENLKNALAANNEELLPFLQSIELASVHSAEQVHAWTVQELKPCFGKRAPELAAHLERLVARSKHNGERALANHTRDSLTSQLKAEGFTSAPLGHTNVATFALYMATVVGSTLSVIAVVLALQSLWHWIDRSGDPGVTAEVGIASFLGWMLGYLLWLPKSGNAKRKANVHAVLRNGDRRRRTAVSALPAVSLCVIVMVVRVLSGAALERLTEERWRIIIPDFENKNSNTQGSKSIADLPQLLRQKFAALGPRVKVVCADCGGRSDDRQLRVGAAYFLKLNPPDEYGIIFAEVYDRRNHLVKPPLVVDSRSDHLEVLNQLADGLLKVMISDGFQLEPEQKAQFDNTPARSAEALKLNNDAFLIIREATRQFDGRAMDGTIEPWLQQLEKARASLGRALNLEPSFAAAIANRAWLDEIMGNRVEALRGYTRASSLAPFFAPFSFQLGRFLLYDKGNDVGGDSLARAIKALQIATIQDRYYWQAFNELGNALLEANQVQGAKDAFEHAIDWIPYGHRDRWILRKNLARAFLRSGYSKAALEQLELAKLDLDGAPLHAAELEYYFAVAYRHASKMRLACESLDLALQSDPQNGLPLPQDVVGELELLKGCRGL